MGVLAAQRRAVVLFPDTRHIFWSYVRWFAVLLQGAFFRPGPIDTYSIG